MNQFKNMMPYSFICSLAWFINCDENNNNAIVDVTIGDNYQGGIIFYIFEEKDNGYVAGEVHGLIAAAEDQTSTDGAEWGCYESEIQGSDATTLGSGAQNTADILSGCSQNGIAAKLTTDYKVIIEGVTYDDWFLPSKDELNLLYLNKDAVGNFSSNSYYYSSTEFDKWNAWCQYMEYDLDNNYKSGFQNDELKIFTFRVRAIRAF